MNVKPSQIALAAGLLLGAIPASAARAGAPRVVRTDPAAGATVAPGLGRIVITFDRPMSRRSHSVMRIAGLPFPPVAGAAAARWRDARTFVLRIGPLRPGGRYGLRINGRKPRYQGFRSRRGVPARSYRLVFRSSRRAARPRSKRARQRGPVVDIVADFLRYHRRAKRASAAVRHARWGSMLEARHRAFFEQVIYRRKRGAERERFKRWCIATFWRKVAPRIARLRRLRRPAIARLRRLARQFKRRFPSYDAGTEMVLTVSFTFRGKVATVNGKNVLAIGLERFGSVGTQFAITAAHELFHVFHFQSFRAAGGLYRSLWAEGLATYASSVLVPGHSLARYLGFPAAKLRRCRKLLRKMAGELRRNLGSVDRRLRRAYLGAEPNRRGIPPEAGYFVGYLACKRLARRLSLVQLARLPAPKVLQRLRVELARLER